MFGYLLFFHILFAASWWGVPMGLPSRLKRALAVDGPTFRAATEDAGRRGAIASGMGLMTFATGLGMIFSRGGFGSVGPQIHAAMTLVVIMLGLGVAVMKPGTAKLFAMTDDWNDSKSSDASALIKRLSMTAGILQLLWVVTLALMLWNRF